MKHSAPAESKRKFQGSAAPEAKQASEADEANEEVFKPLSREEAAQWRARQPRFSMWHVVRWQLVLGLLAAAVAGLLAGPVSGVSALYGALCAVLPSTVMAWGLTSGFIARLFPGNAQASLARLFAWEWVKLSLAAAMLWSAPRWVPELVWLALLAGFVVALKGYWLAFLGPRRRIASKGR